MLYHSVIPQCYTTVLYHSVIPQCYTTVLYHSVIPQCYTTVLYHSVIPLRAQCAGSLLQSLPNYNYVTLLVDPVPMTEKHKNVIMSNYEKLENLKADRVIVPLVSEGIITFDDQEKIKSEKRSK